MSTSIIGGDLTHEGVLILTALTGLLVDDYYKILMGILALVHTYIRIQNNLRLARQEAREIKAAKDAKSSKKQQDFKDTLL